MLDGHMTDRRPARGGGGAGRQQGYRAPSVVRSISLVELLKQTGRPALAEKQLTLLRQPEVENGNVPLYFAGDITLLDRPCVAIVGSRTASPAGIARAARLARELVGKGFVVVSGLALGIDAASHSAALEAGGSTAAVIGTPLDKAYPAENTRLQETIHSEHLLVSPFAQGEKTYKGNFPKRNRVMAAITDATVIIEASDTSGTLHQAAECVRLGRWLFIARSLVENEQLSWPKKFLKSAGTKVLTQTDDVVTAVLSRRA